MIKIKISDLLGKHKMTQKELSEKTGIRPNTISNLYYEKAKRLDIDMIDSLCKVFKVKCISEIIEYIPDDTE